MNLNQISKEVLTVNLAEKFLTLMHRRFKKGGIDRNTTSLELSEILTVKGVKLILEHEVFNEEAMGLTLC